MKSEKNKTRIISLLIAAVIILCTVLSMTSCASTSEATKGASAPTDAVPTTPSEPAQTDENPEIVPDGTPTGEKEVDVYAFPLQNDKTRKFTFRTSIMSFSEHPEIPYISVDSAIRLLCDIIHTYDTSVEINVSGSDGLSVAKRADNKSYFAFDSSADTMTMFMPTMFVQRTDSLSDVDLNDMQSGYIYTDDEGRELANYFSAPKMREPYLIEGEKVSVDLGKYDIDLFYSNDNVYIPFDLFNNFIMSNLYINLYCNGEVIYQAVNILTDMDLFEKLKGYLKDFYSLTPYEYTDDLRKYTYNSTILILDCMYGLKEGHAITGDFDAFFEKTGLKKQILEGGPVDYDNAISKLTRYYFQDLHSGFALSSVNAGFGSTNTNISGVGLADRMEELNEYTTYRAMANIQPFEIVGDTAFITFNSFVSYESAGVDYYKTGIPESVNMNTDTFGIMLYSYDKIVKYNADPNNETKINNVVIDLSCNGGGESGALEFALGFFSSEASLIAHDKSSGAVSETRYAVDCNLDRITFETVGKNGQVDRQEDDCALMGMNIYCLTSPYTFSCANAFAASIKSHAHATIIGTRSGGGSCVVSRFTSPIGTLYQISGSLEMSTLYNGSVIGVDGGVEVDYHIMPENFYNRQWVVDNVIHK